MQRESGIPDFSKMSTRKLSALHFLIVFFLITCDYQCANGQRVVWLFMPQSTRSTISLPQSQNYYYGTPTATPFYPSSRSINSGSSFVFSNFFAKNSVRDQSHSGPFYQRSTPNGFVPPPTIQHILMKEDGSASDIIWQEHDSKRKNKVKAVEIEPVFFENDNNNNILMHDEDHLVRNEDDEDRDNLNAGTSNGSGSMEEFSLIRHPLPFHEDVDKPSTTTTTTNVKANMKCIQPHLEGNQARYDPVTGRCFTVGTRGPCGKMMIFIAVPGDNFNGICSCDYDSFDRPLVPVGGQCHFLFTEAMCYPGYWLTSVTSSLEPVCELNPCYNSHHGSNTRSVDSSSSNLLVFFKDECIPLNSPSRHCSREGEVVLFPKGSSEPKCGFHPKSTKRIHRRQISNIRLFRCRPGERRNRITKKCTRQTKTYFI